MNENEKNIDSTPETNETTTPEVKPTAEQPATENSVEETTPEPAPVEAPSEPVANAQEAIGNEIQTEAQKPNRKYYMAGAIVIVLAIFVAIFYSMEKNGQVNTGIFSGIENFMTEYRTVATVNGVDISGKDYNISVQQISTGAQVQGVDTTDPQVQADIKAQAVEVLVNTELLKQEAESRGIDISDEDVTARYEALVAEVGGEEVLAERMSEFGIDDETLQRDIRNELTIQALLDEVFAEQLSEVTNEEVEQVYAAAGGEEAGLPPLEEVREQIEAQLSTTKEQEVVTNFVELLRTNAEIEVHIEV